MKPVLHALLLLSGAVLASAQTAGEPAGTGKLTVQAVDIDPAAIRFVPPPEPPPPPVIDEESRVVRTSGDHTLSIARGAPSVLPDLPPEQKKAPAATQTPTISGHAPVLRHVIGISATIYDKRVTHLQWTDPHGGGRIEAWAGWDWQILSPVTQITGERVDYQVLSLPIPIDTRSPAFRNVARSQAIPELEHGRFQIAAGDPDAPTATRLLTALSAYVTENHERLKALQQAMERVRAEEKAWKEANPPAPENHTIWLRPHRGSRYLPRRRRKSRRSNTFPGPAHRGRGQGIRLDVSISGRAVAIHCGLLFAVAAVAPSLAQTPSPAQDLQLTTLPGGQRILHWHGHPGRTYFIQFSDPAAPLQDWVFSDIIEYGSDQTISHEIAGTASRVFVRLAYTDDPPPPGISLEDWDADGDGLSNLQEIGQGGTGSHPLRADSSGDGISDGWAYFFGLDPLADNSGGVFQGTATTNLGAYTAGVQPVAGATLDDHDGDGVGNDLDADPQDREVDWEPAPESGYVWIPLPENESTGYARDLNDHGDVLFDHGIRSGEAWLPLASPPSDGSLPPEVVGGDPLDYEVRYTGWTRFNNARDLVGSAEVWFDEVQGMSHVENSAARWNHGQSPSHLADPVPYDSDMILMTPIGIDGTGRAFARHFSETSVGGTATAESQIVVTDATGAVTLLPPPSGFQIDGTVTNSDVSPSGWLATMVTSAGSAGSHRLAIWDSSLNPVAMPTAVDGWKIGVHFAELSDGRTVLTDLDYQTLGADFFITDPEGGMKRLPGLSGKGISLMSGQGTGLTLGKKLWRNGNLIPLRDLSETAADLEDLDRNFEYLAANANGSFLIRTFSNDQSETEVHLAAPVEIEPIKPGDGSWTEILPEDEVVLFPEEQIKIRIRFPGTAITPGQFLSGDFPDITLKTHLGQYGLKEDISLPYGDQSIEVAEWDGGTELRVTLSRQKLINLNLTPDASEPRVSTHSTLDFVASAEVSNFTDSQAFLAGFDYLGPPSGYANNKEGVDLDSDPPQSGLHRTFFQAAGADFITVTIEKINTRVLFKSQAEILYFSGHGSGGDRENGAVFNIEEYDAVSVSELVDHWDEGLNIVIISGCSIVNLNNWVGSDNPTFSSPIFGPGAGYYPAESLERLGASMFLGYGHAAPTDVQNSDTIISSFAQSYESGQELFSAWPKANDNSNGRNATALHRGVKYGYFKRTTVFGWPQYSWTLIPSEEW